MSRPASPDRARYAGRDTTLTGMTRGAFPSRRSRHVRWVYVPSLEGIAPLISGFYSPPRFAAFTRGTGPPATCAAHETGMGYDAKRHPLALCRQTARAGGTAGSRRTPGTAAFAKLHRHA
uniref:Uncharacterized protein n=1 Tax=Ralstonia solanacearum TaxID=305 RepID=A0A0S4TN38_RALSL|nr:protein of unknown function [Ralstonia solanacearum]